MSPPCASSTSGLRWPDGFLRQHSDLRVRPASAARAPGGASEAELARVDSTVSDYYPGQPVRACQLEKLQSQSQPT